MTLTRLLLVAGGGSTFAPPVLGVETVASAPNGGWTGIPDPKFPVAGGKLFLNWVDGVSGSTEYAHWDIASATLSTPVALGSGLADEGPPDNHNSGSVLVRASDSKLVAAYAGHEDTRVRVRISSNALDASAWGSEQVINPGYGGHYTYCSLVELGSTLYLFARSIPSPGPGATGKLIYATSSDGGATWGSWTVLLAAAAGKIGYWRISTDGTYIDFFTIDAAFVSSNLSHFRMNGSGRYTSDGSTISATLPLAYSDLTLVKSNGEGAVAMLGNSYAADGSPAAVMMIATSGYDNSIRVARWSGSAWVVTEVAQADGVLGGNQFASGAAIVRDDPTVVYVSRLVGSKFEMFRYRSTDDGTTWAGTQLTTGSAKDNAWVDTVTGDDSTVEAAWLYGDYTSNLDYDFGVRATVRR